MTRDDDPVRPSSLGKELQTHLPGIGDEIEGAIETLRKLQRIAGADGAAPPAGRAPHMPIDRTTDLGLISGDSGDRAGDSAIDRTEEIDAPASSAARLTAGDSFGRYQISRLLGQGAMGAVYLAYDTQLQRFVALKTPFLGDNPHTINRFYREARAAAQLRSPYLCPIHDVGQIGSIHYLSMAFIDGQPLGRLIQEGSIKDKDRIAAVIIKIARGMQKAHEQGIIHRDLKPDNIMIDADGEPIVMDFGLARRVDDEAQITTPGRVIGTPAYMSPEQAEGDPAKIGPASDIYSLGAILYQMLTGRLPFEGTLISILRRIGTEAPPRPSALVPELGDNSLLEQACLKMMAKAPEDRYPSMAAVAEALAGGPARDAAPPPPSLLRRLFRSLFGRPQPTPPAAAPSPVPSPARAASEADRTSALSLDSLGTAPSTDRPRADGPSATVDLSDSQEA